MMYRSCRRNISSVSTFLTRAGRRASQVAVTTLLITLACLAQDQPPAGQEPDAQPSPAQTATQSTTITIPAGTRIALVLTHPIQSRYIHRGDDIYAQVSSPVNSGNAVVIPPGTFVQGKVDKIEQKGGRGELRLQSMSISFPDGYVAPISGPITLESDEGYALKDPGSGHLAGAFALPMAGAGLGALIGHSTASSQSGTLTSTLPAGCTGPPPGCLSSSVSTPANKGKDTVIGAAVGGGVGVVASLLLLTRTHNFFLDVWSPVEMTLQQPVTFQQNEVAEAVRQSEEHPATAPPIASRPHVLPPSEPWPTDHGTCYTPGTPGTPDTVIPGVPGPDGIPGPPTIIPGTPPTPGTPYPCP